MTELTNDALRAQADALGPWHHKVHLRDDIWTAQDEAPDATGTVPKLRDPSVSFQNQLMRLFPDGLQGRSFLDCACNCGGYSFLAKDNGAGRVLGFDVRKHWINQAEFIRKNRAAPSDGIEFRVADLLEIGDLGEDFDITWFSGIFYHLPDPVASLKLVADRTREILVLNTAVDWLEPGASEQPALRLKFEGVEELMSGVHGLAWMPSGPVMLERVLHWMGFPETRRVMWVQREVERMHRGELKKRRQARLAIVAAREAGRLDGINTLHEPILRTA